MPNGYVITFFNNGDIKQKLADDTILYFYQKKFVDQITLPNKINVNIPIYRFIDLTTIKYNSILVMNKYKLDILMVHLKFYEDIFIILFNCFLLLLYLI